MQRLEIDESTWAELNHLLDAALDQPATERDRWIETLGPEYAALKPRRDLLARATTEDGGFLDTLPKFDLDGADGADAGKSNAASAIQPSHRVDHAHGLLEAGLVKLELREFDAAFEMFTKAEALFHEVQGGRVTPARADLWTGMARLQLHRREYVPALESARKADLAWRDFDPENRWAGEAALWLGRCYLAQSRNADAEEALVRAERVLAGSPIPSDVKLRQLARER